MTLLLPVISHAGGGSNSQVNITGATYAARNNEEPGYYRNVRATDPAGAIPAPPPLLVTGYIT